MARDDLVAKWLLMGILILGAANAVFVGHPLGIRESEEAKMDQIEPPISPTRTRPAFAPSMNALLPTNTELVPGLPATMGPFKILAEDTVSTKDGRMQRRRVVATSCDLGNLLTVEELRNHQREAIRVYSADHVVVIPVKPTEAANVHSMLIRAGFSANLPFPHSPLIYVAPQAKTPLGIFAAREKAEREVASAGRASLDPLGFGGAAPNDSNYGWQWHHEKIRAPKAWDITTGNQADIIAVLDTGIHAGLVEFTGRLVPGTNVINNSADTADDHLPPGESEVAGHGTIVAAVLAANANNSELGAGINWSSRIMPIKVLDSNNAGFYSQWAAGIDFAWRNGARVINLSAGGTDTNNTAMVTTAIDAAIQAGAVFITIAGNDGSTNLWFPGSYSNAITVGATTTNDARWPASNRGLIDLVAPGNQIYPLFRVTNATSYLKGWVAGTSYAAPIVAGAASLLLAVNPRLDHFGVRSLLIAGAEDGVGGADDAAGYDTSHGWGRLNIWNSLVLARTTVNASKTPASGAQLSWVTPTNAATKRPYSVSKTGSLGSPWTNVAGVPVTVVGTNATWTDPDGVNTGKSFYRLNIGQ